MLIIGNVEGVSRVDDQLRISGAIATRHALCVS